MGSRNDPLCGIPLAFVRAAAGKSDYARAFFSPPREFASRPRRDATRRPDFEDGTGIFNDVAFLQHWSIDSISLPALYTGCFLS